MRLNSNRLRLALASSVALSMVTTSTVAQTVEVLYTKIDASSTSSTPWTLDLAGSPAPSKFKSIDAFTVSHDGATWVLRGTNRLGGELENMLVLGDAQADPQLALNLAQEGQAVPTEAPGVRWHFFDGLQPVAFDTAGNLALHGRTQGPPTGQQERIMKRSAAGVWSVVLREGDPLHGLRDSSAGGPGDEGLGSMVSGVHLLDDGRVGYIVTPIQNCHSSNYPAFLYDDQGFMQSGVSMLDTGEVWDDFDPGGTGGTPDGAFYYSTGVTENLNTSLDDVFAVNNVTVFAEGQPVAVGGLTYQETFEVEMAANGNWIARGDDSSNDDWCVVNGTLVAQTGMSVEGGAEAYSIAISACALNANGDWAVTAGTDHPDDRLDEVLVVNGKVIVREGDPVDLDGNGVFDDGAFIGDGSPAAGAFAPSDLALTDDGMVYFIGRLNDGMGNDLDDSGSSTPDAFLRIQLDLIPGEPACFGDGSGTTCPCGNAGAEGEGCANSTGSGALLGSSGEAIVGADTLVLRARQCPANKPGLFLQADGLHVTPPFLGDGLLCLTGTIRRLDVVTTDSSGVATLSGNISLRGGVGAGDTRSYQYLYRDPTGPCSNQSNSTPATEISWQ